MDNAVMITDEDVQDFNELIEYRYGVHLSDAVARDMLQRLIQQVYTLYRPITKSDIENLSAAQTGSIENENVNDATST